MFSTSKSLMAVLSAALLGLTGCDHHGDHGSAHESGHGDLATSKLALNDGEKWPVDEHTRAAASRISALVSAAKPAPSALEARELAGKLGGELDLLISGCTMTGAAHDQLHIFLVGFFGEVEKLKVKEDPQELRLARSEIDALLEAYEEHFE